jgi:hypothetical protein
MTAPIELLKCSYCASPISEYQDELDTHAMDCPWRAETQREWEENALRYMPLSLDNALRELEMATEGP